MLWTKYPGKFGSLVLYGAPIVFYIISNVAEGLSISDSEIIWKFLGGITLWAGIATIHFTTEQNLDAYYCLKTGDCDTELYFCLQDGSEDCLDTEQ